jgi:hypothetical protein
MNKFYLSDLDEHCPAPSEDDIEHKQGVRTIGWVLLLGASILSLVLSILERANA